MTEFGIGVTLYGTGEWRTKDRGWRYLNID
jgi:hypothetical protein